MLNEADRMAKRCCGIRQTGRSNYFHDLHAVAHYFKHPISCSARSAKDKARAAAPTEGTPGDHK
jgi:hypothetical protein